MSEAETILKKLYEKLAYRFSDKSGTTCNVCGLTRCHSDERVRHLASCELVNAALLLGIPHVIVLEEERPERFCE